MYDLHILSLPQPSGRVLFRDYATGDLAQVDLQWFFPNLFIKLLVDVDLIPQFQHIAVKILILWCLAIQLTGKIKLQGPKD